MAPKKISFTMPAMKKRTLRLMKTFPLNQMGPLSERLGCINRESFTGQFFCDGQGELKKIICLPGTLIVKSLIANGHYLWTTSGHMRLAEILVDFVWTEHRAICEDGVERFVTWNRFWQPLTKRWEFIRDAKGDLPFPEADFGIFSEEVQS